MVPDRNQPFQRPRARPPFPFFEAPDELCVFCFCLLLGQGRKEESFFGEMNWHAAPLFLAPMMVRPLHPSLCARRMATQTRRRQSESAAKKILRHDWTSSAQ